ncbi:hypothetical protein [Acidianus sp. HS-5]|uniref:hypothetical protein n=1 Tax=Acidianus sp. HS-5 TaxID=2886040 RepID=UPI001F3E47AF|nr:hypothetical protein [Acidianus sp. HS-5]BDC17560.1 hypothetical protein HS5_04500 [Acidianus sp. HS-5]
MGGRQFTRSLYFSLIRKVLVYYSKLKEGTSDLKVYKLPKIEINEKLAKIHSGGLEAIYTGRFIDVLETPKAEELGIKCNDDNECSIEVLKLLDEIVKYLRQKPILGIYDYFPNVNKLYLKTILHEYVHWLMLSGTRTAVAVEKVAWKERIDTMYFTSLFYQKVNLGKLLGKSFAREDKAEIIGDCLDEERAYGSVHKIKVAIDEFSRTEKGLYAFLDVVEDFGLLAYIGDVLGVIIEPTTWAIVEDENYFNKYVGAYFGDSETKRLYAKRIYEESLDVLNKYGAEEVIRRAKWALNDVDIASMDEVFEALHENFQRPRRGTPSLNASLKDILPMLVLEYSKEKLGREKIDFIVEGITSKNGVLSYVLKSLFKLKAEMSAGNLPSICSNVDYNGKVVGGCYNPDIGITGNKIPRRPFNSFENLVGNLALSLKLSLLLAHLYVYKQVYNEDQYCNVVAKLSKRAKYSGVDFYKVACSEVNRLPIDGLGNIIFYKGLMEGGNTREASKALSSFLIYWVYLVMRTGNRGVLGSRHGIYFL